MMCPITKWFISRSLDSDKEMPALFRRHLRKCASCREFQRSLRVIQDRAAQDARAVLHETPEGLTDRVKAKVFQPHAVPLEKHSFPLRRRFRIFIPAASTALAAALLAVVLIWQPFQSKAPEPAAAPDTAELSLFNKLARPGESMKNVSLSIESPYERELETLTQAVRSASRHVLDKLDLRIGS